MDDDFEQDFSLDSPPPPQNDRPLFHSSDGEDDPPPPSKPKVRNRPTRPRFLGDSDDDDAGGGDEASKGGAGGGGGRMNEVDAMFEGLDWSDDDALPPPVRSCLIAPHLFNT